MIRAKSAVVFLLFAAIVLSGCKDRSRDPAVQIAADDPRIAAATQEAQRRWPEFVALFKNKKPNTAYAVKRPFPTKSGGAEHMWVQVVSIKGSQITGRLDNDPIEDVGVANGESVTFDVSEMEDWLVARGKDDILGAFSVNAVREIEKEKGGH